MHAKATLPDLAAELLAEVMKFAAPADGVVGAFFRRHRRLGPRERQALADTVYEVLRRRRLWEHLAATGRGPIARRLAYLAWQGSEASLQRALAADEATWLAQAHGADRSALAPALRHNLPEWIAAPLASLLGEAEFDRLADSLLEPAALDLRVNTLKARRDAVQAELAASGIEARATTYSPSGLRIVAGKPALEQHPAFLRGDFEIQDEGSQLLALAVGAKRGEMVVDFCAGGGGKTLALGVAMRDSGRLYAFDTSAHRLEALKARVARSGLTNVYPIGIAHERDGRIARLAGKIDRVLVDAPCSGLGTLRRHPDLKWRHSPQAIDAFAAQQSAILAAASRLLKPGGRLVYATCSLLPAENEAVAEAFGAAHAHNFTPLAAASEMAAARLPPDAAAGPRGSYLRLWPQRHHMDGFFAAIWQRRA